MISIFILAFLAILTAAMASYAVYTTMRTTETLTMTGRNAAQMDGIVAALKSNIRAVSSFDSSTNSYATEIFLPTPDVDVPAAPTVSYVPSWIESNARTPWGASYGYCAYAPSPLGGALGAAAATTPLPYSTTVAAGGIPSGTQNLTAPDGSIRSYMVSGARPANAGDAAGAPSVLGFLVSPALNATALPSCDSIVWSGGLFRSSGGVVVPITDDAAVRAQIAVPAVMIRYVAPAGGGDGGSTQYPETLSSALADWKAARPAAAVLYLTSGTHTLAPAEFSLVASDRMSGRGLHLQGVAGSTTIADSGAAASLSSDADLVLDGITLGPGVSVAPLPGARFQAYNSQLRYVLLSGAQMTIGQGSSVSAAAADVPAGAAGNGAIDVIGGNLTLIDSGTKAIGGALPAALSLHGGFVSLDVGGLQATGSGAAWAQISGGGRVSSISDPPSVTWNGAQAPSILPAGLLNGRQRTVQTQCSSASCAAQCMAQPAAGITSWFVVAGACAAAVSDGSISIVAEGAVPNANPANLPTDWQCGFAAVATQTVPAPALPANPGTATAICAPVPAQ